MYVVAPTCNRSKQSGVFPSCALDSFLFAILKTHSLLNVTFGKSWPLLYSGGLAFSVKSLSFFILRKLKEDKGCLLLMETWFLFLIPDGMISDSGNDLPLFL